MNKYTVGRIYGYYEEIKESPITIFAGRFNITETGDLVFYENYDEYSLMHSFAKGRWSFVSLGENEE